MSSPKSRTRRPAPKIPASKTPAPKPPPKRSINGAYVGLAIAAVVVVIALVGERGREVREFVEKDLGPEGMKRAVVVVATSDTPAPLRLRLDPTG